MLNVKLSISAPCEYAVPTEKNATFYCMYHKKHYKGYSACNERCSLGRRKIEAMEKTIELIREYKRRKNRD